MPKNAEEDLFEGTTMTFGEHLEELRICLFRAVVGLVIGFLVGLLLAKYVVHLITFPLTRALDTHFEIVAEEELARLYGSDIPDDLKQFMKRERLLYEEVFIERAEIQRLGARSHQAKGGVGADEPPGPPQQTEAAEAPADVPPAEAIPAEVLPAEVLPAEVLPRPTGDMVKTRIWRRPSSQARALSSQEPFMIWLKAAFFTGLLIASPYIFYQLWAFVAAGLYKHEKRYVHVFLPISLVLFWSGALLAFFFAFDYVLKFLFSFNRMLNIQAEPRISEWIGFVLFLPLGFGIAFQLPLVMFFLNRIGIFTVRSYLEKWRIAVLVIFVISMLLTPADPISMLLMAVPLCGLYFLGVGMAQWMPRGKSPFGDAYDP